MAPRKHHRPLRRRTLLGGLGAALAAPAIVHAQSAQSVTIATFPGVSGALWRDAVATPFTAQSGIRTEIFEAALPSMSIYQARGRPQFDAAVVANYQGPGLSARSLLEELTPDDIPAIRQVPEANWLRGTNGKLLGMPLYFTYYGIAFNSDVASAKDFQSWNDLLDPKWKGKVSLTRPNFLAAYDLTLFAHLNGGTDADVQKGFPVIKRLADNAIGMYSSMASLQSQLGRGEVVAAPFYSNQVGMLKRSGVRNVDITIPREGGLNLTYNLVIPKGARNVAGAKRLLNAIIEEPYQLGFARGALSFPANPNIRMPDDVLAELGGSTTEMMTRNYTPDWWVVGTHLTDRTRQVEELLQAR